MLRGNVRGVEIPWGTVKISRLFEVGGELWLLLVLVVMLVLFQLLLMLRLVRITVMMRLLKTLGSGPCTCSLLCLSALDSASKISCPALDRLFPCLLQHLLDWLHLLRPVPQVEMGRYQQGALQVLPLVSALEPDTQVWHFAWQWLMRQVLTLAGEIAVPYRN